MGKNMKHAAKFARQYPGWHSHANDRATIDAIRRLVKRGIVEMNVFGQFRAR